MGDSVSLSYLDNLLIQINKENCWVVFGCHISHCFLGTL